MSYKSYLSRRNRRVCGFTLVEMLLVIVIIGIVTAVSVPSFVKSMRGNRRRMAARTIVAAGRYARSMAVLHQRTMAITFNLDDATLLIAESGSAKPKEGAFGVAAEAAEDTLSPGRAFEEAPDERPSTGAGVSPVLNRKLDKVTIAHVNVDGEDPCLAGVCVVLYQSNGRCIPYEVRIVDDQEGEVVIKVDALASVSTAGGR